MFWGFVTDETESIDTQVKYIKEEVMIRIESLKFLLDELGEKFKLQLQLIKENIIKYNY